MSHRTFPVVLVIAFVLSVTATAAVADPTRDTRAVDCSLTTGGIFVTTRPGEKDVSLRDLSLCVTGTVTVTFAGDPASGCATRGVCDYRGRETWDPDGGAGLELVTLRDARGHERTEATLTLDDGRRPIAAVVTRTVAGAAPATCRDRVADRSGFGALSTHHGMIDVTLGNDQVIETRCAGPLAAAVARALPHHLVALSRLRRGSLTLDLSGTRSFHGDGFSGTVASTVTALVERPVGSPLPTRPPSVPASHRLRVATARYRITDVRGTAISRVRSGPATPLCAGLDACGVTGSLTTSLRAGAGGSLYLDAGARRRRPARDLLTALGVVRGGVTHGIELYGGGTTGAGRLAAAQTQDGSTCHDRVALAETALAVRRRGARLFISLTPVSGQAADPLRTSCPGPELGERPLARATLPLSALRHRRLTLLLHGTSFHDGPYSVATRSTLRLTLRRRRVTTMLV